MATLTVIVTAYNDPEGLKYTLEGLCEQTSEDFDVIIVDNGSTDETSEIISSYCKEYVGFESMRIEHRLTPGARNEGVKRARGELVWFVDCADYLAPESVEKLLEAAENKKADIYVPRYYNAGENEPYYDNWVDQLAIAPEIDSLDRALLNTLDFDGRVLRKKFFDLYSLYFPETPVFYNAAVMAKCLFGCAAKISGVPGAIYSHRKGVFNSGFAEGAAPSRELLDLAVSVYEEILDDVKVLVKAETGSLDGDEFALQETLAIFFGVLANDFYRYFWYIDDDCLKILREKFEELSSQMTSDRKSKVNAEFSDLRFPGMYVSQADAANTPMFSLIAEFPAADVLTDDFLHSLYTQRFPFFELFIKKSVADSPAFPENARLMPNLHILPDEGFFAQARKQAKGCVINVKDDAPVDPRVLSELSLSKAPRAVLQYMFAAKRKKYSAKTYLKQKGVAMK